MKRIFAVVAVAFTLLLVSCYEINELIEIKENGSGVYSTKMDMSGLLEIMESMGGSESLQKEGLDKSLDTMIYFKSMTDTMKNIDPKEKKLFSTGRMHMVMNMSEKKFLMDMDFKFDDLKELEMLMSGAGSKNFSGAMKNLFGGKDSSQQALDAPKDLEMDQMSQIYEVKVLPNKITKTLNKSRYDALMSRPEMAQMDQFAGMGIEILMTSTIKLPRPVKKSDNALLKLSDDKKTITFKYNVLDAMKTPEKYAFEVEY